MPTGYVNCRFVGGPWDGNAEVFPAFYCRERMRVELGAWFVESPDGTVSVMKGPRGPAWTSYAFALYEKDARRSNDGGAVYRYRQTVDVRRCAKVLPDLGRRCKNEAIEGSDLCRDHEKIRKRETAGRRRRPASR